MVGERMHGLGEPEHLPGPAFTLIGIRQALLTLVFNVLGSVMKALN
jgi:hypothetical protein